MVFVIPPDTLLMKARQELQHAIVSNPKSRAAGGTETLWAQTPVTDLTVVAKGRGPKSIKRMFLQPLVQQPTTHDGFSLYQGLNAEISHTQLAMSFTSRRILKSLMTAMEELELNAHNTTVRSDHTHMYLYVI